MKREFNGAELNKVGLFRVFANMDTQSAVVAAFVISLTTLLATGFINLCNYIYWNAYFTRFNIPLAYIDEAIIHENGTKYMIALLVPLFAFFWWILTAIKNRSIRLFDKVKEKRENRFKNKSAKRKYARVYAMIMVSYAVLFVLFCFVGTLYLLMEYAPRGNYIVPAFGAELFIFVLYSLCRGTLGKKKTFSKKVFYGIRILCAVFVVYAVLAGVYFSGSLENYENRGAQSLQIINDANVNFHALKSEEKINSQLVLFETKDYYYVTDVTITGGNAISVRIWDDDTYRFINKIDCPVKTVWANLYYIGGNRQVTWELMNNMCLAYAAATVILGITFVCLFSVPRREEVLEEKVILQTNA